MDAATLLKRQGWRGLGHSLDNNDRGIARPLLITRRQEGRGLGSKKTAVADQWWMRAYDTGLKELGTGKQTELSTVRQNAGRGTLYMSFVKGGLLPGTMPQTSFATEASTSNSSTFSPSENSTTAMTPDPDLAVTKNKSKRSDKEKKSEKKRKREEHEDAQRDGEKDGAEKKRKTKDKANDRSTTADTVAAEELKLVRRAAKKALRLERAGKKSKKHAGKTLNSDSVIPDTDHGSESRAKDSASKSRKDRNGTDAGESGSKTKSARANADAGPSAVAEGISNKKLQKYAAKAAAKGITVEAYMAKKAKSKGKSSK
ncbi:uncharacterized protein J3D65DRAFT_257546 [Phyllosticta citribraziliensis]|uniref:G-patch domain-containing protein n=1 Tax=Phyllosticta citribraziliensis TaxID=989973 RepID=A0ABR1M397_9PEZI